MYVDIVILGLLLCFYIHMFNVLYLYYYLFHDLNVNFLIPLYGNIYLVYRLYFINFGGLGSFLTYLRHRCLDLTVQNCAIGI